MTEIVPQPQQQPFDLALYLVEKEQQITSPTVPGLPPLPPPRTGAALWRHFGRVAPGLVPTVALALAAAWGRMIPDDSAEPLWVMGVLTALAGTGGVIAAAKQHGDKSIMGAAFATAGTFGLVGVAAWTPHWPVSVLMWLAGVATAYALCVPHWRADRRQQTRHEQDIEMEHVRGYHQWRDTATRAAAAVETAKSLHQAEVAKVQAILAASEARTRDALLAKENRTLAPGQELDVEALLRAAGHNAP